MKSSARDKTPFGAGRVGVFLVFVSGIAAAVIVTAISKYLQNETQIQVAGKFFPNNENSKLVKQEMSILKVSF